MPRDALPILGFADQASFETWLEEQHARSGGLWLKIAKKGADIGSVSYDQALEAAICFGWIDGQKGGLDDDYWLQRFTPRKPRSKWSKVNTEKAAALIAAGRMRPAGQREVDLAKADGRWEAAYQSQGNATVPDDLQRALDENEAARAFFATLNGANRYAVLYRIGSVKRPETRARKIAQYVEMLAERKTIHP
jgi:uncharacterized protein YdeI (YjbR/CyaY-like superfamily)